MKKLKILMVAGAATMLSSCDLSQIPGLDGRLSIEDSKAVGAACRHSGRALEDCFALNPNSHQAGVFEGWRDMNDYMLANQIETVKPEIRNSAYSSPGAAQATPGAYTGAAPSASMPPGGSVPSPSVVAPGESVPLASGRQRWLPKGVDGAEEPQASPDSAAAAPAPEPPAAKAPASPELKKQGSDTPSRPWERNKDPKKHT